MSDFIDFGSVIVRKDQIVMIETFEESGKFTFKIILDKSKSEHGWVKWDLDSKESLDVYMNYTKAFLGLTYDKDTVKGSEND